MRVVRADTLTLEPAGHEPASQPGVLRKILARKEELFVGRVQMINWAVFPANKSFARHYHEDMEEVFVFLDGPIRAEIDLVSGERKEATFGRGDCVVISPNERHKMWNESGRDLEYVVIGISGDKNGRTITVE